MSNEPLQFKVSFILTPNRERPSDLICEPFGFITSVQPSLEEARSNIKEEARKILSDAINVVSEIEASDERLTEIVDVLRRETGYYEAREALDSLGSLEDCKLEELRDAFNEEIAKRSGEKCSAA